MLFYNAALNQSVSLWQSELCVCLCFFCRVCLCLCQTEKSLDVWSPPLTSTPVVFIQICGKYLIIPWWVSRSWWHVCWDKHHPDHLCVCFRIGKKNISTRIIPEYLRMVKMLWSRWHSCCHIVWWLYWRHSHSWSFIPKEFRHVYIRHVWCIFQEMFMLSL